MRPTGKVIGRILSLGFPLPGPSVDNYNIITAPAFFDYDALVVEASATARTVAGVRDGSLADAQTFGRRRVCATPDRAEDVALDDLLAQRRDETRRALERGAVVVCFAHPPASDEYCWLPDAVFDASLLVPADGTRAHVVEARHPLAAFVIGQLANLTYRVRLREDAHDARVFVVSHGGAPIGAELRALNGRLVLLPAITRLPAGDARYVMSDALQAGIRRALGVEAEGRTPAWAIAHAVPGLAECDAAFEAVRGRVREAEAELAGAQAARDKLASWQALLWQEGAQGLEAIVVEGLRLLGFDVYSTRPDAIELRTEGVPVFVEIEASEHPVDMGPHYRLRQRIEEHIARRGEAPRGLLIVNGCRLTPVESRPKQVTEQLQLAAETMRYAITTTAALFVAACAKLTGDDEAVAAYRRRVVTENGLLA